MILWKWVVILISDILGAHFKEFKTIQSDCSNILCVTRPA
jgi:hypothetical protein